MKRIKQLDTGRIQVYPVINNQIALMSSGQGEIPDRRSQSAGASARGLVEFQNRRYSPD